MLEISIIQCFCHCLPSKREKEKLSLSLQISSLYFFYFEIDLSDGIEEFRRSVSNGPLPNPRVVSRLIHRDNAKDTHQFTMMVMQWGQFIDHDVTSTPVTRLIVTYNSICLACVLLVLLVFLGPLLFERMEYSTFMF